MSSITRTLRLYKPRRGCFRCAAVAESLAGPVTIILALVAMTRADVENELSKLKGQPVQNAKLKLQRSSFFVARLSGRPKLLRTINICSVRLV